MGFVSQPAHHKCYKNGYSYSKGPIDTIVIVAPEAFGGAKVITAIIPSSDAASEGASLGCRCCGQFH